MQHEPRDERAAGPVAESCHLTPTTVDRSLRPEALRKTERSLRSKLKKLGLSGSFIDRNLEDAVQKGLVEYCVPSIRRAIARRVWGCHGWARFGAPVVGAGALNIVGRGTPPQGQAQAGLGSHEDQVRVAGADPLRVRFHKRATSAAISASPAPAGSSAPAIDYRHSLTAADLVDRTTAEALRHLAGLSRRRGRGRILFGRRGP